MKRTLLSLLSLLCLILLAAAPALAAAGAARGLTLWAQAVLPCLLPFMIASGAAVALGGAPWIAALFSPVFQGILRLSPEGSYVMAAGLVCGCPMGARTCSEFLDRGLISSREAAYLLAIANHPSPMFILGYTASLAAGVEGIPHLPSWLLPTVLYLPIPFIAFLARNFYVSRPESQPPEEPMLLIQEADQNFSLNQQIMDSFETMVKIGGYIMIFSIVAAWISRFAWIPLSLRCALLGAVEITTGIQSIARYMSGFPALAMIAASAAFGGLSGLFQTRSVLSQATQKAGLSIRHYVFWKFIHCLLTLAFLAFFWQLIR